LSNSKPEVRYTHYSKSNKGLGGVNAG
jgi:hypothetical protein